MGNVLWKRHVFGAKALAANRPPIRFFATPKHKRKKGQPPEVLTPLYKAPLYAAAGLGNMAYRGVKNTVLGAAYNMYPLNVVVANRTEKLWRKRRSRWENAAVKVRVNECVYWVIKGLGVEATIIWVCPSLPSQVDQFFNTKNRHFTIFH